jgi:hypothetical protein
LTFAEPSLQNQKEELDRMRRELNFANERLDDATRSKSNEVSSMASVYKRQIHELEDSLKVEQFIILSSI